MELDPYLYPESNVLINKFDIRDIEELRATEVKLVALRMASDVPTGNFDLKHLQAIHKHLFQDVYDWAGKIRTIEMRKGDARFQRVEYIKAEMAEVHNRLVEANFLRGCGRSRFSKQAAEIIGAVQVQHPFREGNSRSQLMYLKQLAAAAGHFFDHSQFPPLQWVHANLSAYHGEYDPMMRSIYGSIIPRQKVLDRQSARER